MQLFICTGTISYEFVCSSDDKQYKYCFNSRMLLNLIQTMGRFSGGCTPQIFFHPPRCICLPTPKRILHPQFYILTTLFLLYRCFHSSLCIVLLGTRFSMNGNFISNFTRVRNFNIDMKFLCVVETCGS